MMAKIKVEEISKHN